MKAVKEGFIIFLLLVVIAATLGILYYNCFPNNKVTPGSIEYTTSEVTKSTIQQIDSTKTTAKENELLNGITSEDVSNGTVLASYTVGVSDINRANRLQKIQEGKANPFAEYKEEKSESGSGEEGSGQAGSSSDKTSGGKLFENSKSK